MGHRQKFWIILAVMCLDFLAGMEFDLFVPSFPELRSHFDISPFAVEALLSINFIGYCIGVIAFGELGDRYSKKPILLWGLGIFIFGSVLCVWGNAYIWLLVGRCFQGVGVAAPAILSFLIIADLYALQAQQRLMSFLNASMNIGVGLAPILGSYITLYFGWKGNFYTLLVFGIVVLGMTIWCVPNKMGHIKTERQSTLKGYIALFRSKPLMILIAHIVFMIVPYWIFVGMSPLLYIQDLGVPLAHFGYYQGLFAFVFAIGSLIFGLILPYADSMHILRVGAGILLVSCLTVGYTVFVNSSQPLWITLAFLPFVIGQIVPSSVLWPLCINFMEDAKGKVSAVIQVGKLLICALSLQIAGWYYDGTFRHIGIIVLIFMIMTLITFVWVLRRYTLFARLHHNVSSVRNAEDILSHSSLDKPN